MINKKPIPKAQVRKTEHGYQVYAAGPKGHIAQGQPHKDKKSAQKDAKHFEEVEDVTEGPLQDRRQAQARKRQSMDALRRKQVAQKQLTSRAAKDKEKSDIASRRGIRSAQASKHAQKNWRAEAIDLVDAAAAQISADFDPRTHKVPRPAGMSQKEFDYKYKPTKVRKPKKSTGMKTPETQAALKYLQGKGPSPYGPGGKYEPKKINAEVELEAHDCKQSHPGMTHTEWEEDQKIESTYSERISSGVPEGNASGAKGSKKKELFKARKFRTITPGQVRDFERLSAARMFQAYEQRTDEEGEGPPITNTKGVVKYPIPIFFKKRKKVEEDGRIDGRTRGYRETVQRVQARRDAKTARELEQKLNMFGVQNNPFKEETEMENNNKYLKTKEGSIEEAVLKSLMTETPVNPNDARPTLHLPEKKYLTIKKGSLQDAVADVLTEAHAPGHSEKSSIGTPLKHPPSWKKGKQKLIVTKSGQTKVVPKDAPEPYGQAEDMSLAPTGLGSEGAKELYGKKRPIKRTGKNRIQPESAGGRGERDVGSQAYTDYIKNLTPGEGDSAIVDRDAQKAAKASQEANKEKKLRTTRIDDEYVAEKEVKVKDTRRVVDAIRAYDRSKDASRDATSDTDKGEDEKGDIEKKYAKKERGEIKKDDPNWKSRKYHTGMHGEETDAEAGHATALYKDQWKDRKRADWDKEHGREKMAKQDRADAEVDRKRMWGITQDKWKHAKYASGEEEGKRTIVGNTPSPKDAYKEEVKIDVAQILESEVKEEVIVGLLDMGIILVNENTETGFEVINQPQANRENLLRMAYNTGAKILDEYGPGPTRRHDRTSGETRPLVQKRGAQAGSGDSWKTKAAWSNLKRSEKDADTKARLKKIGMTHQAAEYEPQGTEIDDEIKPLSQEFVDAILNSKWIGEKKLSYKERQGLSTSQFALPGKGSGPEGKQGGSYPIPDESHARNALARVSQHGSEAEKAKVRAAVKKKFPGIDVSEDTKIDEIHSAKDTSAQDTALAKFLQRGGVVKKLKSKGVPKYAKAAYQKSGSGKSEEVELDEFGISRLPKSARGRQHPQNPNRDPGAKSPEEAPIGTHAGRFLGQRDRPKKKVDPRHPQGAVTSLPKKEESVEIDEKGNEGLLPQSYHDKEKKRKEKAIKKAAEFHASWKKQTAFLDKSEYEPQGTEIDEWGPRGGGGGSPIRDEDPKKRSERLTKQKMRAREKYAKGKEISRANTARMNPEEAEVGIARDRLEDQYTPGEMILFKHMLRTAYGMDEGSIQPGTEKKRKRETAPAGQLSRGRYAEHPGGTEYAKRVIPRYRKHGGISDPETKGPEAAKAGIRGSSAGQAAHRRERGVRKSPGVK